ncbi:hypothetical protein SB00610_04125 [Klebsiella quasipneumoniae subsp. similipneumoniae]|nr:hypothetical protein SB00610_04125 [Klebsiella quasipneumoniae subsp. similipneumoniae]
MALHRLVGLVAVNEGAEQRQTLRIVEGGLPLALVAVDDAGHLLLQLLANAEAILQHHLPQVGDAALQVVHPGAGALQAVGGTDIEHQQTIDAADQRRFVEIAGKQVGVTRFHSAVAADVEIPAFVGGNHSDIFALGFGALAGAARDRHLDLVRGA